MEVIEDVEVKTEPLSEEDEDSDNKDWFTEGENGWNRNEMRTCNLLNAASNNFTLDPNFDANEKMLPKPDFDDLLESTLCVSPIYQRRLKSMTSNGLIPKYPKLVPHQKKQVPDSCNSQNITRKRLRSSSVELTPSDETTFNNSGLSERETESHHNTSASCSSATSSTIKESCHYLAKRGKWSHKKGDQVFDTKAAFAVLDGTKAFLCPKCENAFADLEELKQHVVLCWKGAISCILCEKTFFGLLDLSLHLQMHKNKLPVEPTSNACLICCKFDKCWNLKEHWRAHMGVNLSRCMICKQITEPDTRCQHLGNHQVNDPSLADAFFWCPDCKIPLRTKFLYLYHRKVHANKMPSYLCEYCGVLCKDSIKLELHVLCHTDSDTVFKCTKCYRIYPYRAHFEIHTIKCSNITDETGGSSLKGITLKIFKTYNIGGLSCSDLKLFNQKAKEWHIITNKQEKIPEVNSGKNETQAQHNYLPACSSTVNLISANEEKLSSIDDLCIKLNKGSNIRTQPNESNTNLREDFRDNSGPSEGAAEMQQNAITMNLDCKNKIDTNSNNPKVSYIKLRKEVECNGSLAYVCQVCDETCLGQKSFLKHLHVHTGYNSNQCNLCQEECLNADALKMHMLQSHRYQCDTCSECLVVFKSTEVKKAHLKAHQRKCKYICEVCGVGFKEFRLLECHVLVDHAEGCEMSAPELPSHGQIVTNGSQTENNPPDVSKGGAVTTSLLSPLNMPLKELLMPHNKGTPTTVVFDCRNSVSNIPLRTYPNAIKFDQQQKQNISSTRKSFSNLTIVPAEVTTNALSPP